MSAQATETARRILALREEHRSRITGHARHRRFRYDPYVRLFTEEGAPSATSW